MINLPQITLLIADDVNPLLARNVLNICQREIEFGAVKLLTSHETEGAVKIPPLTHLTDYSVFMLTTAHNFIDTEFCLVVQRDGFILNPGKWDNDWLRLDYIAPLFMQYDFVGSGGFSLRSKRMMETIANDWPKWDGTPENATKIQETMNYYEDGVISFKYKHRFKIASAGQACEFGQGGNRNPKYFRERPLGFHRTWQKIDFKTGRVDSSDLSADLCRNYDSYINEIV
jgi:hypothetical protein